MNIITFKRLWIITQVLLFFLPIFGVIIYTPYEIDYDRGYVQIVTPRVLDQGDSFEGAVEDWKDSEGIFYDKDWKLKHIELYWIGNILMGIFIGLMFQIFNLLWMTIKDEYNFDNKDEYEDS